jgi:hypothetical protein
MTSTPHSAVLTPHSPNTPHSSSVLIVGGGPSGIGAALGAARAGAKVTLVERHPALGGMGTSGLVNNFCPAHWDGQRLIIGGVFGELRRRLIEARAIYSEQVPGGHPAMEIYDPDAFERLAADMCREAGVELCLCANCGTPREDENGLHLTVNGRELTAKTLVDTSGDAGFARALGCETRMERGRLMPLTYCFLFGPIDLEALAAELPEALRTDPLSGERHLYLSCGEDGKVGEYFRTARAAGDFTIPRKDLPILASVPGRPEYATVNIGRVFCEDPTDPDLLAAASRKGEAQVHEALAWFAKYWPGMQNVKLIKLARQIGVRETRQIVGNYTLTREDVTGLRQFDHVICQCWYPIDVHHPDGSGTTMVQLPFGSHYDIPLECLIPAAGSERVIVGGRCISATQEAMSSFRVSPSVMAIGEAAGVTAALAARVGTAINGVSYENVRRELLKGGAILE